MKTKPTTVDAIDIHAHHRYAFDQASLDPTFLTEPTLIAPHSKIAGISNIFSSKWEELFDIQKRSSTWAHFTPPSLYSFQSNRFFSYCLLPDLYWECENEEENPRSTSFELPPLFAFQKTKRPSKKEIVNLASLMQKDKNESMIDFEKDKNSIITLLEALEKLNKLLSQIHSKKLQYQKG